MKTRIKYTDFIMEFEPFPLGSASDEFKASMRKLKDFGFFFEKDSKKELGDNKEHRYLIGIAFDGMEGPKNDSGLLDAIKTFHSEIQTYLKSALGYIELEGESPNDLKRIYFNMGEVVEVYPQIVFEYPFAD